MFMATLLVVTQNFLYFKRAIFCFVWKSSSSRRFIRQIIFCKESMLHECATLVSHPSIPPQSITQPRYSRWRWSDHRCRRVSCPQSGRLERCESHQSRADSCQENRTFDHYFGYYPHAGAFGVPANYSQPDGNGGTVTPHHFDFSITGDPSHTWQSIHSEWDRGKMDRFYTTDGDDALGYYDGSDLGYYYALAGAFTLCGKYFCSVLGPTVPNRTSLVAATCGGYTSDSISNGALDFPTIVDLLDQYKISWKCYNLGLGLGSTVSLEHFNPLTFFKRWQNDPRLFYTEDDYHADLDAGTLPQVSFLITEELI